MTAARAFAPAPVAELVERFFPRLRDIRVPLAADTALFDPRRAEAAIGFRARHVWTPGGAASEARSSASAPWPGPGIGPFRFKLRRGISGA